MVRESAEVRGQAMLRPFRVAKLIDTASVDEVRTAIGELSGVWGGMYIPLFDINRPFVDLEYLARIHDVDAIYLDGMEGELADQLRRSGWDWGGRGPWGPFASDGQFRKGLLPAHLVAVDRKPLWVPQWTADDDLDLFYSAVFGFLGGDLGQELGGIPPGSEWVGFGALFAMPEVVPSQVGVIQASKVAVAPQLRHYLDGLMGVFVARPDHPEDLVAYWNLRSFGNPIVCVPSDGPEDLLSFLTRDSVPGARTRDGSPNPMTENELRVWGLEDASITTRAAIDAMAARSGLTVFGWPRDGESRLAFPGLETAFNSSVRAEFAPTARSIALRVPSLPLIPGSEPVMPGVIAVDLTVHNVTGLDPRATGSLPPYRRHAKLLERITGMTDVDHVRVSAEGDGVVFGLQATHDEVPLPFPFNLDAIETLFDDKDVKVSQSDDGRFQTRAAEMLGGPFGGLLIQPGVRAVIDKAARSNAGLTLQHLKAIVNNNRGEWPDTRYRRQPNPDAYAEETVNHLLLSGLFVPMLDVHCSSCRVESQASPRDLDTLITCEFCGEQFRLALSLSLSRTKSRWRYRLASHLSPEKVRALLPALATMSMFGQLPSTTEPPMAHAFGVSFKLPGSKQVEVDVVAYLGRPTWGVVLGEVKNNNRIDENDVRNLEELQRRLHEKSTRAVLVFATLKNEFSPAEVEVLRAHVERCVETTTAYGALVPRFPFVLTAKDLSLPWGHEDHPWRWEPAGQGHGVFGTAEESCKRNLGLARFLIARSPERRGLECTWADPITHAPAATQPAEHVEK